MSKVFSPHPPLWSPSSHRLRIAIVLMLVMYCMINLSASLGISMVCMVNSTAFTSPQQNKIQMMNSSSLSGSSVSTEVPHVDYGGTLLWEPPMQSALFSALYYGGLATIFISGPLADRFGPKRLLLGAILVISLIVFLAPSLAQTNYWMYFVARVMQGMAEGFIVPSVNSLGAAWFPPQEKSSMAALYTSGVQISAATSPLIGSRLCGVNFLGGWPLIFYLFGSMGVLWLLVCLFFVSDRPAESRWISREEKNFLETSLNSNSKNKGSIVIPWRSIFTSTGVYACVFANFSMYFCTGIVLNFIPLYFKEELHLSLHKNGMYSIAPFVGQIISKNTLSILADRMKREKWMSNTATVRIFQAIGSFGTATVLICLATLPSSDRPWIAAFLLFTYGILYAAGIPGSFTSMLVIAPAYTGTITSLAMVSAQLGSAIAPNIVSVIAYLNLPYKWSAVFGIAAGLQILSGLFFSFFGSGSEANWAKRTTTESVDVEKRPLNNSTEQ